MHRPAILSLSLLVACGEAPQGMSTSEGGSEQGSASESESESGSTSDSSSEDETETETETETGDEPEPFDPLCGEWTSTLVRADHLDEVWLDGDDLIATGGRSLVERSAGGAWSDYVDFSLDVRISAYDEVWGPPDDRWVLARDHTYEVGVYHYDGAALTLATDFPDDNPQVSSPRGRELVGRGPDDVWALTASDCFCVIQPCACEDFSELLHWDGQSWSEIETPGRLTDITLTQTGMWGVGKAGLIARYDGQNWTIDDAVGQEDLEHVWALDDDEVWAAGNATQVMHRSGGVWTTTQLTDSFTDIAALEGLAADRVWAIVKYDGVWAYDGDEWTKLFTIGDAGALAIVDGGESLIVVGGVGGHVVWEVDTTDGSATPLHVRPEIHVGAMIADDVDHMLLSTVFGDATWRVTEGVWEPAYGQLEHHFNALLGPVDDAIGVRDTQYNPTAVWQLGEYSVPLSDPVESGLYHALVEHEGQTWVGGREYKPWDTFPMVYAHDSADWIDHSPPLIGSGDLVTHLTTAGGRLFARLTGYSPDRIMYLDDEEWVSIDNPVPDLPAYGDIAATAADRLWATIYTQQSQTRLVMWDGTQWQDAASLWPQLAEQGHWLELAEVGDGRLWLLSSSDDQAEQLAYFDGNDWTIVDTPPQLHGWYEYPSVMAVGTDGLFIYDSIYVWRYAFCPSA